MISENLANLPGVDASVDWERIYVNDGLFRSVLGNVSNADEGLPRERLDYYLVRDYSRNDRVGKVISNSNTKMYFMVQKKVKALLINKEILLERKRFRKEKAVKI